MTRALTVNRSANPKLGPIPTTYTQRDTCPPACPLLAADCYAQAGFRTRLAWDRADSQGREWPDFLAWVAALPVGALWRHNTAGDLPGASDKLDADACLQLARAGAHTAPICFTHYPVLPEDVRAGSPARRRAVAKHNLHTLRRMILAGFPVNASANGEAHAARLARLGLPVASVSHREEGSPHRVTLDDGTAARACPATIADSGVTCASCRLCAKADRKVVPLFPAHGTQSRMARDVARNA